MKERCQIKLEAWESVTYDTISLKSGKYSYSFFHVQEIGKSDEDLRMIESEVTKFILKNFVIQFCQLIQCKFENSIIEKEIVEPYTRRDLVPGDVDLII